MISALNFKIGGGGGTCADASVQNSDLSYDTTVASGDTLTLPDVTITDSDGTPITVPAVQDFTCTPIPVGATLMKTGQTTSYRTGDDGDLEAGRAISFTTLAKRNPFGNNNRFTDELGGQTYTDNIVIDWSTYDGATVLGYKRTATNTTSGGWNNAIDTCLAISIGTFTTGWRLANVNEWNNVMNRELANPLGYSPMSSFIFTTSAHTSSTYKPVPSVYSWGASNVGSIFAKDKNENSSCLAVRTFTVTGTTLT
jgi:hypothetical protein